MARMIPKLSLRQNNSSTAYLSAKNTSFTISGDLPASTIHTGIAILDNSNNIVSSVYHSFEPDGYSSITLQTTSTRGEEVKNAGIKAFVNEDGTSGKVEFLSSEMRPEAADNSLSLPDTYWVNQAIGNKALGILNYELAIDIPSPLVATPYTCPTNGAYIACVRPSGSYANIILNINGKNSPYRQVNSGGYTQNKSTITAFLKAGDVIYWTGNISETYSSAFVPFF